MIDSLNFKIIVTFILSGLVSHRLTAQTIFPENISYDSLLHESKEQRKPMFLVVHKGDEFFSPFRTALSKGTKALLSEHFVCGMVQLDPDDFNHTLQKKFYVNNPMYLFMDSDGFPLLRHNKPITEGDTLIQLIDSARTVAKGETMGKLMAQYKKGIRSRAVLTKLLEHYQKFDLYTDQRILNDYISLLTVRELNNFETVVFLLSAGPVYNGQIYQLARTNHKMVDSLYATLPLSRRQEINGRINRQTFREALDKKDFSLAQNLGYSVSRSWSSNYLRAQIGRDFYPMEYSRVFRDTAAYIMRARNYYNGFFYRVESDSLAKLDFANERGIRIRGQHQTLDSAENVRFKQWWEKNSNRYNVQRALNLSYGARQLLDFGRDNPEVLFDAIRWQQKAILLRPGRRQYHHTLAELLYCVGFYTEAEAEQQEAVNLSKKDKARHQRMRDVLKQIKDRSL